MPSTSNAYLECNYSQVGTDKYNKDSECSICLDNLEQNHRVYKLGCEHIFHKGCMQGVTRCPLCSLDLGEKKIVSLSSEQVDDRIPPLPSAPPIPVNHPYSYLRAPSLDETISKHERQRQNLFLSSQEVVITRNEFRERLLEDAGAIILSTSRERELFADCKAALLTLASSSTKKAHFFNSMSQDLMLEALNVLRYSNLSDAQSRHLTEDYYNSILDSQAKEFAQVIVKRLRELRAPFSLNSQLDKVLSQRDHILALLGNVWKIGSLERNFIQNKLLEYTKALTYLKTRSNRLQFLALLKKEEMYELIALMTNSSLSTRETKDLCPLLSQDEKDKLPKQLLELTAKKYTLLSNRPPLSTQNELKYLEILADEKVILDAQGNYFKEKFYDYYQVFSRLKSSEIVSFMSQLPRVESLEILTLLYSSSLSTASSKYLVGNYVKSQKFEYALCLAKQVQDEYESKTIISAQLDPENSKKRLHFYRKCLLGETPPMQVSTQGLQTKMERYVEALNRLGFLEEQKRFVLNINDLERLELLCLLGNSSLSTSDTKAITQVCLPFLYDNITLDLANSIRDKYDMKTLLQAQKLSRHERTSMLDENFKRLLGELSILEVNSDSLKEKFNDYTIALNRMKNKSSQEAFLNSLCQEERLEVLLLLTQSTLSTPETQKLLQTYKQNFDQTAARILADRVRDTFQQTQEKTSDSKIHAQNLNYCRFLLGQKICFSTDFFALKADKFSAYMEALARFKSIEQKEKFISSLNTHELLELLTLFQAPELATAQSQVIVESYLKNNPQFLEGTFLNSVKEKYRFLPSESNDDPEAKTLNDIQEDYRVKLLTKASGLDIEQNPRLLEKFQDYGIAIKLLSTPDRICSFLSSLDSNEALEVLTLLRCSSLSTDTLRDQTEAFFFSYFKFTSLNFFFKSLWLSIRPWVIWMKFW